MQDPFSWLNPPAQWQNLDGNLTVTSENQTDFWRKTEYGFIRDSGHFAYIAVAGDFTVEVTFVGKYEMLFDQAGLMIRLDADRWIKTGIEYVNDTMNFSTVVTDDTSDWSLIPLGPAVNLEAVRARLVRKGSTVSTAYRLPGRSLANSAGGRFPERPTMPGGTHVLFAATRWLRGPFL